MQYPILQGSLGDRLLGMCRLVWPFVWIPAAYFAVWLIQYYPNNPPWHAVISMLVSVVIGAGSLATSGQTLLSLISCKIGKSEVGVREKGGHVVQTNLGPGRHWAFLSQVRKVDFSGLATQVHAISVPVNGELHGALSLQTKVLPAEGHQDQYAFYTSVPAQLGPEIARLVVETARDGSFGVDTLSTPRTEAAWLKSIGAALSQFLYKHQGALVTLEVVPGKRGPLELAYTGSRK